MGILSSFWASPVPGRGTRAQCVPAESKVQPQTLVLCADGPWRPLESPPLALELSGGWGAGVGSSVSMMPTGVPCKPGRSGRGASHFWFWLLSQGAGGQRATWAVCIPWCPANNTPLALQAEASLWFWRDRPQCWYQAGWFPRPKGGRLEAAVPAAASRKGLRWGAPHPKAPRMGPNHGASISEGTALGSLRVRMPEVPQRGTPCPPMAEKGRPPLAKTKHMKFPEGCKQPVGQTQSPSLVSEEFVFPDSVQVCFNPPKEELSLINKKKIKMVEKKQAPLHTLKAPGRQLPKLRRRSKIEMIETPDGVSVSNGKAACPPSRALAAWEPPLSRAPRSLGATSPCASCFRLGLPSFATWGDRGAPLRPLSILEEGIPKLSPEMLAPRFGPVQGALGRGDTPPSQAFPFKTHL